MLKENNSKTIKTEELEKSDQASFELVDIRDKEAHEYSAIPSSKCMPDILDKAKNGELSKEKTYILYCADGKKSPEVSNILNDLGYDTLSLEDGYEGYLKASIGKNSETIKYEAERTIIKTYRKELLSPFLKALDRYEMLKEGDKIAVCISGGKDSMLLAKLFQELHKFSRVHFELIFIVMDPGYNKLNRLLIEDNARKLGIPIEVFETNIFNSVDNVEKSPCYLCARMRRGHLYAKAKSLGCNKIALGHHFDDVIETIFMGMMYGAQIQSMMPKLKSDNFEGMELIRPMYLIREKDIIRWRDHNNLNFIQCACHFTDMVSKENKEHESTSKRKETKKLIEELKKVNPYIEQNIFKSVENVCLDCVISYKRNGVRHHFLEEYDEN